MAFLSFLAERAATGFGWLDELSKLGGGMDCLLYLPIYSLNFQNPHPFVPL